MQVQIWRKIIELPHKILISNQVLVVLGKYLRFVVRVQNSKLKDGSQIKEGKITRKCNRKLGKPSKLYYLVYCTLMGATWRMPSWQPVIKFLKHQTKSGIKKVKTPTQKWYKTCYWRCWKTDVLQSIGFLNSLIFVQPTCSWILSAPVQSHWGYDVNKSRFFLFIFIFFCILLAPTGALIVTVIYYIYIDPQASFWNFEHFCPYI